LRPWSITFGTGLFWLLLATIVGESLVGAARASRRARQPPRALEQRIVELQGVVAALTEAQHAQDREIAQLREQLEFTERLLAARSNEQALR
jgi:hypothetical protein